ncbi:MAG: hypothetical protein AB1478_04260 [Nitrospirota bacterium]
MRKVSIVLLLLVIATPLFAGNIYYNGKVTKISDNVLIVDSNTYRIADNCRVAIHFEEKRAFHEKPATLKDLKVGDWVTIRTDDKTVTEVLIEQYRK